MSDKIDIMLNSGDNISLPTWALETTQKEVLTALVALGRTNTNVVKYEKEMQTLTQKMFKEIKTGNKDEKEATKDQEKRDKEALDASKEVAERLKENKKALEDFKSKGPMSTLEKTIDSLESDFEMMGGAIAVAGEKILLMGSLAAGAAIGGFTFVGNALLGAGHQLNELTKSGVGFNTTFADVGKGATEAVAGLGALGVGFEGAAVLIAKNSNVVATAGFGRFQDTMKFAADTSEELGMSFDDAMNQFADGMSRRQSVMDLSNVSQKSLTSTIQGTVTAQRVYSQALGVSSTHLEEFVDNLIRSSGALTASLLTMNNGIRNQVVGGIEVFASGLAALGGQAGQGIAEAFTEAASKGAIGLSDEAIGYVTALPSLQGPMNDYIQAVQSGTLTQEEAKNMVTDLTMNLGNLSSTEKSRIQALARVGDQSAQQMAQAIAQFEQSENKIKELNKQFGTVFDMDTVQKGTNEFNKVLNQAKGAFSNAFYSLFADPDVTSALSDGLKEIMEVFGFATDDMSGAAMNAGSLVKGLAEKAVPVIQSIMKSLKGFAEYIMVAFEKGGIMGVFKTLLGDAIGGVVKALIKYGIIFAGMMFAGRYAVELAKSTLLPQAKQFGLKMFQGAAGAGKQLMQNAQKWMSTMLSSDGAKKVQGSVMKGAGILKDKIMGSDGKPGVGAKVADKLQSFQKDGSKMTDKLSGAMTKGGSSGGFLKSIADGVKKFGDTKVVKGAASLALLGGAVALAAIGLKQFNSVDFASIVKGTIALGGLVGLTKLLGKGSSAMIKGAAAVAILGASVVPLAFALNMMKDVGMGTLGVLATALIGLTAAAVGMGFALPFILMGSVAIAALGVALIPLGIGLKIVSMALPQFTESLAMMSMVDGGGLAKAAGGLLLFAGAMALMVPLLPFMLIGSIAGPAIGMMAKNLMLFNDVDMTNLMMAGAGMKAISEGMAAMSGGSLKSSIMDGIGSIFGADSPIDKLKAFIGEFKGIDVSGIIITADALTMLSISLLEVATAIELAINPLLKLGVVLEKMSGVGILKLAAVKALGLMGGGSTAPASLPATPGQNNAQPTMGQEPLDTGYGAGVANPDMLVGGGMMPGIQMPMSSVNETTIGKGYLTGGASYGDDDEDIYGDNPATFGKASGENAVLTSVAKDAGLDTTGLTTADAEGSTATLDDINNTLLQLLDSQNVNNKTAKKQQRSIEGLEI